MKYTCVFYTEMLVTKATFEDRLTTMTLLSEPTQREVNYDLNALSYVGSTAFGRTGNARFALIRNGDVPECWVCGKSDLSDSEMHISRVSALNLDTGDLTHDICACCDYMLCCEGYTLDDTWANLYALHRRKFRSCHLDLSVFRRDLGYDRECFAERVCPRDCPLTSHSVWFPNSPGGGVFATVAGKGRSTLFRLDTPRISGITVPVWEIYFMRDNNTVAGSRYKGCFETVDLRQSDLIAVSFPAAPNVQSATFLSDNIIAYTTFPIVPCFGHEGEPACEGAFDLRAGSHIYKCPIGGDLTWSVL